MDARITADFVANAARVRLNGYELPLPDGVDLSPAEEAELDAAIHAYNAPRLRAEAEADRAMRGDAAHRRNAKAVGGIIRSGYYPAPGAFDGLIAEWKHAAAVAKE